MSVSFLLRLLAAILFAVAALNVASPRVNILAAGLFCWVVSTLVTN